jgi:uncharacterized surface protein with fasciclin (FAS1) repeats
MKYIHKYHLLILGLTLIIYTSCKDQWEDHNSLNKTVLSENLYQLIGESSSLAKFCQYLKTTGYDTVLTASKTYTVWAPNDEALSNLDTSITNNPDKLKRFISNHISYREYPTDMDGNTVKIKMLSGKNIEYTCGSNEIDGSVLVSSNTYCKNGILHEISTPLYPKSNLWEYPDEASDGSIASLKEVLSYTVKTFDEDASTRTGTNAQGESVYDTVWVYKNLFLNYINDVSNEDSVYTLFLLSETAFTHEYDKIKPYIADTTENSASMSDGYTRWDVCKDIVIRGKYSSYGDMPDTLVSTQGIKIPKNKITIESSYEASNGMAYIVSSFDIPLINKIPTVVVEAENYTGTYNAKFESATVSLLGIRARSWASGGKDLYIPGGAGGPMIANLSVGYHTPSMYTLSYNVYWRAVNDFQTTAFTQKIAINAQTINDITATTYKGDTLVNLKTVKVANYSEVLLGKMTNKQYGILRLYLAANGLASSSTTPNNPVVLDYLKLVPVFN